MVFAEQENGVLSGTDFELLAKAHDLKAKLCGTDTITAVLLGDNVSGLVDTLYAYGAEQVIIAENPNLAQYSARPYEKVLVDLANKYKPSIFLFAASPIGRDVAPRVMCDLRTGLTADAIDLDVDETECSCRPRRTSAATSSATSSSSRSARRWSPSTRRSSSPLSPRRRDRRAHNRDRRGRARQRTMSCSRPA